MENKQMKNTDEYVDYRTMYFKLDHSIEKVMGILQEIMQETEEIYMNGRIESD